MRTVEARMKRRRLPALFAIAGLLALAGCGGSSGSSSDNGVAGKAPGAIVQTAVETAKGAGSMHIAGSVAKGGQSIKLDLDVTNGKGGGGTLTAQGKTFQILSLGNFIYLKGGADFWKTYGAAAAQLFAGKWLKAPAGSRFGSFGSLTDVNQILDSIAANKTNLSKGATTTVDGQKVVQVKDNTSGGFLYVATTGKPYPVEIVEGNGQSGTVRFDRFGEKVSLSAPAGAIDLSQLKGG